MRAIERCMPGSRLGPGRGFGRATQRDTSKYKPTKYMALWSLLSALSLSGVCGYIYGPYMGGWAGLLSQSFDFWFLARKTKQLTKQDAAVTVTGGGGIGATSRRRLQPRLTVSRAPRTRTLPRCALLVRGPRGPWPALKGRSNG